MAQTNPDRVSIAEILKLVDLLPPNEQEELLEEMKLQWLRREIQKGGEQADRGELVDGDTVFAELKQRYQNQIEQSD